MAEIGIDLSREQPKRLTTEAVEAADVVITMGCGDACPVFPGKRYLDWELTDPAGKTPEQIRPIRDDIDARVRGLLDELGVAPAPGAPCDEHAVGVVRLRPQRGQVPDGGRADAQGRR